MRKLLVLTVLGIVAAFGFNAAAASAANCTPIMDATYFQGGYLKFGTNVTNCTDVDQVQFSRIVSGIGTGWRDVSTGTGLGAPPPPLNLDTQINGRAGVNMTSAVGPVWKRVPWCGGQVHIIFTQMVWRIHRLATQTWGSWFTTVTQNYPIVC